MLPVDLLRVRIREGLARPSYITEGTRDYYVLVDVLELFKQAEREGWRLGKLDEKLSNLSEIYDHRLVKGLYRLLRRRLLLSQNSRLSPRDVRRQLFSMGPVVDPVERKRIISAVASRMGVPPGDLEDSLFSDIESEKVVAGFRGLSPGELASWYNAELVETVVARSVKLSIRAARLWSSIIRKIKSLGLMYEVKESGEPIVEVTGPASLIKLTERYGRLAAEIIPLLVEIGDWEVRGVILLGSQRRSIDFLATSSDARFKYPSDTPRQRPRLFDSSVEEKFYNALRQAAPYLRVVREPAPIKLPGMVMIPDFAVESSGRRVYVEIVGFWTREYIKRKVEKLRHASNYELLVLVNKELGLSSQEVGVENVLFYEKDIPIKAVVGRLKALLGKGPGEDSSQQGRTEAMGVKEHATTALTQMLESLVGKPYNEVERVLRPVLGDDWVNKLRDRGYAFDWRTLDLRRARLVKLRGGV